MKDSGCITRGCALLALVLGMMSSTAARSLEDAPPHGWVLGLSWWPESCAALKGEQKTAACVSPRGFVVRGLSPKSNIDQASVCAEPAPLSDALIERMAPLVPTPELMRAQWREFGACSGLDADAYFELVKQARNRVQVPDSFLSGRANQRISKTQLEKAFLESNPGMTAEAITIECRSHYLTEVRVCFDRDLQLRACGPEVGDICEREIIIRPRGQ